MKHSGKKAIWRAENGAYFCYCAYVLRISRYLGFLWVVPTLIQGYFCAVENYTEKAELSKCSRLVYQKKIGGSNEFFRDTCN